VVHYSDEIKNSALQLRLKGLTNIEIQSKLRTKVPKSTLSFWFKNLKLSNDAEQRLIGLNLKHLSNIREKALKVNKLKRERFLQSIEYNNIPISVEISSLGCAKIALAMLFITEGSKSCKRTGFLSFGNSNAEIVLLFLTLLKRCFDYNENKIRCTVQCRADQNVMELESYWVEITGISRDKFYKAQIDKRTNGKPTKKSNYKGVLRIDYFSSRIPYELENLAKLIYNRLVYRGIAEKMGR